MYTYISEWRVKVNNSHRLMLFREIKENYGLSKKLRQYISKICMSSHWLNIEYCRHRNTERQNRLCELCE